MQISDLVSRVVAGTMDINDANEEFKRRSRPPLIWRAIHGRGEDSRSQSWDEYDDEQVAEFFPLVGMREDDLHSREYRVSYRTRNVPPELWDKKFIEAVLAAAWRGDSRQDVSRASGVSGTTLAEMTRTVPGFLARMLSRTERMTFR